MATTVSGGPPARPLRVLIVTDQYEPMVGGVPTVTRELAAGLGERGHAVAVLALLTGFDPDVAHLHSPLTLGAAARSAAPAGACCLHQPLPAAERLARRAAPLRPALREAAFYACLTRFANRCDQVTAPSATALRLLREHGLRAPAQTVSNGIDRSRFRPGVPDPGLRARFALPPGRPVVLAVGRLSPEKRVDVLIAALARLADTGDGPLSRPGRADGLADCLALLCRDARLRARMGRASARIAGEHDRGRVLDRWESLYRALAWPAAGRLLTELSDARP